MHISIEGIEIPEEKIIAYLLVAKKKNDKSAFLDSLGYTMENWGELVNDIRQLVILNEAVLQKSTQFGEFYEVQGSLRGLAIVTIWLVAIESEKYRFITLFPHQ